MNDTSNSKISQQNCAFEYDNTSIEISCHWRQNYKNKPSFIHLSWHVMPPINEDLWAVFLGPDTKVTLCEVFLGNTQEGEDYFTAEELGFDPSNQRWAIAILVKKK